VGNGGFSGRPDEKGCVEIGYEIAPLRWDRGYGTAVAAALLDLARDNGATRIIAHSAGGQNASNKVMSKLGMTFVQSLPNAEVGTV